MKKNWIEKLKKFYFQYHDIIYLVLPFLWLDLSLQLLGSEIAYFPLWILMPELFTAIWLFLIISICLNSKRKYGFSFYILFLVIAFVLFFVNGVYYSNTKNFFDFSLLESASEASPYILSSLLKTNIFIYISILIFATLVYFAIKVFPNTKTTDHEKIRKAFVYFLIVHTFLPVLYGFSNKTLSWNTWKNPQNIYQNFNDSNKSFSITGIYEYSFRNMWITLFKAEEVTNETEVDFLENAYSNLTAGDVNAYTGIFKNNNVIFLQLEGIDNWLLTEDTMPTLYGLQENSINFNNHFSFYSGGGSTFNSEFAVNTGFITPISYNKNAYSFNHNTFTYSLANLLKNENYQVNAFHMNSREYYSRGINYENWGYNNYYGLKDKNLYLTSEYQLDTELIKDEDFYNLMFKNNGLFANYIITYSNHMPFSTKWGVCRQLINKDLENDLITKEEYDNYTEEDCIRRQAKETDDMIALLLEALEDNDLADNTVLVIFTDHYLYTVNDENILNKYKDTSNNLINKTPFLIYKKNQKRVNITNVTSQVDILPTVLNLFGINYIKDYYIGSDALDTNYSGIVFFNDYSWFDGLCYVENGSVSNECVIDEAELERKNEYVNNIIQKNDLTLKYNYFEKLKLKIIK